MKLVPHGSTSVMARRVEPPDSLDYFPTPPWATRALCRHVLPLGTRKWSAWDPACGEGHMSGVLEEFFEPVLATDVFDYGRGFGVSDFLDERILPPTVDWIITNPPFKAALDFTRLAIGRAKIGCAMLVRTTWLESSDRYYGLFRDRPPTIFAPFVERVPMVKGRWDPKASTATSYAWFVWIKDRIPIGPGKFQTVLIPPGCRTALTKPDDVARFTKPVAGGFLE